MYVRAIIVGIAGAVLTALIAWSKLIPDSLIFHSAMLVMIGSIYMGFAFADGRIPIIVLELTVATVFIVLALLGLWQAPFFIGIGLILHGFWDLAHHPRAIKTKLPIWYPPFCAAFDFIFAAAFFYFARGLAART
ncbi:MAG TPA: DUF6010 family protein [Acidobacteriota bacterium]|nr:DUF6010 family protein [Acidobacteriota bacterium]